MTQQPGFVPSLIRTYSPIAVGAVVTFLARKWGILIDEQTSADLTLALGGLAMALYYTLVRIIEQKVPQLGWLIGLAKAPAYSPAPAAQPEPTVVPDAPALVGVGPAGPEMLDDGLKGPVAKVHPMLGRLRQFDPRSANFPIRALLIDPTKRTAVRLRSYTWPLDRTLDQGTEGACVGFSITHELAARPVAIAEATDDLALRIYKEAQKIDQWPGEGYSGTSVLAGMKVAAELGYFDEYRWAFGLEDLVLAVGHHGPAVIGIDWYEGMFEPDEHGFLETTGALAGGHAICVRGVRLVKATKTSTVVGVGLLAGYDLERSYVTLHNSWGPDWGDNGKAKVRLTTLDSLLKAGGEAAVPVVRRRAA